MKKKNNGKTILTIFFILIVITAAIYLSIQSGIFKEPNTTNTVRMAVNCDGGYAIITYTAGDKKTNEAITVTTPWKKSFEVEDGESVFLTAGNPTQSGTVACLIELNDRKWKTDTVDFPKQAVACGGIIPHK